MEAFGRDIPPRSIPLGSVKSNIGHLKGAAGAAGLLKTVFALHEKALPPSLNFDAPNPNIDFEHAPFYVNTELKEWPTPACGVRRAGVSAFGFGGTNFHAVLEEHVPGRLRSDGKGRSSVSVPRASGGSPAAASASTAQGSAARGPRAGRRLGGRASGPPAGGEGSRGRGPRARSRRLRAKRTCARRSGWPSTTRTRPSWPRRRARRSRPSTAGTPRSGARCGRRGSSAAAGRPPRWPSCTRARARSTSTCCAPCASSEPVVKETFAEADRVMTPLLGRPLSEYIFVDPADAAAVAQAEEDLKQTADHPARGARHRHRPDPPARAPTASPPTWSWATAWASTARWWRPACFRSRTPSRRCRARGREMTRVSVEDNGKMAAVFAPIADIEKVLAGIDGYLVIANYNSRRQAVIGGASAAVVEAVAAFTKADDPGRAPAREPCLPHPDRGPGLRAPAPHPRAPAHRAAPAAGGRERHRRLLRHGPGGAAAHPRGAEPAGGFPGAVREGARDPARGGGHASSSRWAPRRPSRASSTTSWATTPRSPRSSPTTPSSPTPWPSTRRSAVSTRPGWARARQQKRLRQRRVDERAAAAPSPVAPRPVAASPSPAPTASLRPDRYQELGRLFAEFLERGLSLYGGRPAPEPSSDEPVVITGCGLGLPGLPRVFDDSNAGRLLRGEQLIGVVPTGVRSGMADKHIVRLVKSEVGESRFETIDDVAEVIKLAGRAGALDLEKEFGVSAERIPALDVVTRLAIGAGLEALRDAGIPLVMRYKTTTRGTSLPERWALPDALRDDTGVIFASAFPGLDSFAQDLTRYHEDRGRREQLALLRDLRSRLDARRDAGAALAELDRRIQETEALLDQDGFVFDRRFLFRVLSMGHSQFAEHIGARGPNTQVNAACASTTQAVALAEDWIRAGRCRRVIIVSGRRRHLRPPDGVDRRRLPGLGSGRHRRGGGGGGPALRPPPPRHDRRHGRGRPGRRERGGRARAGHRPDLRGALRGHRQQRLPRHPARRPPHRRASWRPWSPRRSRAAASSATRWRRETVFVSHETYTPARGGSASAEVHALRSVFGSGADSIVMANTKGFTGHPMGVGIEDVVAVRSLETGLVPPVANFKEVDPELGALNLSRGGGYPVRYALRLAAGFGSQIGMALLRWVPPPDGRRRSPEELGFSSRIADAAAFKAWLGRLSGYDAPELEVDRRTLRVQGPGSRRARRGRAPADAAPRPWPGARRPAPRRLAAPAAPAPVRHGAGRRQAGGRGRRSRSASSRSSRRRRAIRRTCWPWTWTSRPTSASTPSSRPSSSPPCARMGHPARREAQAARLPHLEPRHRLRAPDAARPRGQPPSAHRSRRAWPRLPWSARRVRARRRSKRHAARGQRPGARADPGPGHREDGLSAGHAGRRAGPRSRPRRRHRQAGGAVRLRAREVGHPPRREPQAPGLPDPAARHRLRPPDAARPRRQPAPSPPEPRPSREAPPAASRTARVRRSGSGARGRSWRS